MVIKRKVATRPKRLARETRHDPWWKLAEHSVEIYAAYYELSERTCFRLRNSGIDLADVRAVLAAQAENARASRGPVRASLTRWCEWQARRNRNREELLGL